MSREYEIRAIKAFDAGKPIPFQKPLPAIKTIKTLTWINQPLKPFVAYSFIFHTFKSEDSDE